MTFDSATPARLITDLARMGVTLTLAPAGDSLRYKMQSGALPDDAREVIEQHRAALLAYLQAKAEAGDGAPTHCIRGCGRAIPPHRKGGVCLVCAGEEWTVRKVAQ